jgi:hypothetical protein
LGPNAVLSSLFYVESSQPVFLPSVNNQVSYPYRRRDKTIVLYIAVVMLLDSKRKAKVLNRITANIAFPYDCEMKHTKHIEVAQNEAQQLVFLSTVDEIRIS